MLFPAQERARASGMANITRVSDATQFVSYISHSLKFHPVRSLVIVPLHEGRSRGIIRLDLPARASVVDEYAATVMGMVCRVNRVDAFLAVVYTDREIGTSLPHRRLVRALLSRADACGLTVLDVITVTASGWGAHSAADLKPGGRDLAELALPDVPRGHSAATRLPHVRPETSAATRRALGALEDAHSEVYDHGGPTSESLARHLNLLGFTLDPVTFVESLPAHDQLCDADGAALLWCLTVPALRDVALVQWAADEPLARRVWDAQRQWHDGEEFPVEYARIMWGDAPRPDHERLRAGLELSRQAAARAPRQYRVGALAACAWLSWALGESSRADAYVNLAGRIEPQHGLCTIVRTFLASGHLPEWAFSPAT